MKTLFIITLVVVAAVWAEEAKKPAQVNGAAEVMTDKESAAAAAAPIAHDEPEIKDQLAKENEDDREEEQQPAKEGDNERTTLAPEKPSSEEKKDDDEDDSNEKNEDNDKSDEKNDDKDDKKDDDNDDDKHDGKDDDVVPKAAPAERRQSWPLPDPENEGDLTLHGAHLFDRLSRMQKRKLNNDADRAVQSYAIRFLRRVAEYLEKTPDFKIMPVLCRDMRELNSTRRWEIEIENEDLVTPAPFVRGLRDQPLGKDEAKVAAKAEPKAEAKPETSAAEPDAAAITTLKPQETTKSDERNESLTTEKPEESNVTTERPIDQITTVAAKAEPIPVADLFEMFSSERVRFYGEMGRNFGRLIMREYRKEQLSSLESSYLARWVEDEAVHYGACGIYCTEGENVKDIMKQLNVILKV